MKHNYRTFFGFNKAPFAADIKTSDILKTPELIDVEDRFGYVISLGAIGLITGEVGSGKTTALRYVLEKLHPSEYRILYVTASSGSISCCSWLGMRRATTIGQRLYELEQEDTSEWS